MSTECEVQPFSSRGCDYGTPGCEVDHPPLPAPILALQHAACNARMILASLAKFLGSTAVLGPGSPGDVETDAAHVDRLVTAKFTSVPTFEEACAERASYTAKDGWELRGQYGHFVHEDPNVAGRSYWRNGHIDGRTIYRGTECIGQVSKPEYAALIARAVNAYVKSWDDEYLGCTTDDYQTMRDALIEIMGRTEHDGEIFLIAAKACLPPLRDKDNG